MCIAFNLSFPIGVLSMQEKTLSMVPETWESPLHHTSWKNALFLSSSPLKTLGGEPDQSYLTQARVQANCVEKSGYSWWFSNPTGASLVAQRVKILPATWETWL